MTNLWQSEQFQLLWRAKNDNRLPHALLFTGLKGTHKAALAQGFCAALLCQQVTAQGKPCGQCQSCRLIAGRVHPNVLWVEPEKAEVAIKVDQIRAVNDFINHTSLQGEHRIVIIHPADEMNISAANALLKTLEEPSTGALLILINDQRGRLPATILSRCQRVLFPPPTRDQALVWLTNQPSRLDLFQTLIRLAEGKGDPIKSASELQNNDPLQLLDCFLSWVVDLLRLQLNSDSDNLINKDFSQQLMELKQKTQLKKNIKLMEYVQHLRTQLCEGINFNKQLMLESLFIEWIGCD